MNTLKQVEGYKLTFEAIQQVRQELSQAANENDTIKVNDALQRLSNLYASIDAKQFIECINSLEAQANVIKVDFKTKTHELKKAVNAHEDNKPFTMDDIPF